MLHPVSTKDGMNFEREAVMKWFQEGFLHCPITGKPLLPRGVITNHPLLDKIRHWRASNEMQTLSMAEVEAAKTNSIIVGLVPTAVQEVNTGQIKTEIESMDNVEMITSSVISIPAKRVSKSSCRPARNQIDSAVVERRKKHLMSVLGPLKLSSAAGWAT